MEKEGRKRGGEEVRREESWFTIIKMAKQSQVQGLIWEVPQTPAIAD
jgi:hypothetical protein